MWRLQWRVIAFMIVVSCMSCGAVNWTDLPQLRMAQSSIYSSIYIPLNTNSLVSITYNTPFASPFSSASVLSALVLSGFQNYLQFQMIMNVTISTIEQTKVIVNVWVGAQTIVKQMRVNYFIMQKGVGTLDPFIQVSIGNYRTLDLDEANGPRYQYFEVEPALFSFAAGICSAIHGFQYYNTDGIVNQIDVNTSLINTTSNLITHNITIGQKGRLNYISITTILISPGFYPTPNNYLTLGVTLQSTIRNDFSGLDVFSYMSSGGLFASTQNSLFFGMSSFNFTMQGSRLFMLNIATNTNFSKNLITNNFMKYTVVSGMVLVKRVCNTTTDYYYVEGFTCVPTPCVGLYQDDANSICKNCLSTCDGCTASEGDCQNCKSGTNRVVKSGTLPSTCQCDYDSGYVQVNGKDICQLCSTYLPGCVKCQTTLSCDYCGDTAFYEKYQYDGVNYKCQCKYMKYLVTGKCLSYPGCLVANKYITGEFCQQCDTSNNFQKNLTNNSSCVCMLAYFPDSNNKSKCLDICGDGRTPASLANATGSQVICDDGNTVSGDGCSATCTQQFGYLCHVQVPGGNSKCAEKQQINITYLYSEKNLNSDSATIVFALSPPQNFLTADAFADSVYTSMKGNKKITFDPVNSLILITVDYSESLEGNSYQFDFSFVGLNISSDKINQNIQLNGRNAKLIIGIGKEQVMIINYVGLAVSALALVLALVVSFLGEKMMGIELILPVQAGYFTIVTFPRSILSPVSALWSMKFSNGFNSIQSFGLTTNHMLDSRITLLQYAGQYLLNYNIMYSFLALVIVIFAIIIIRVAWLEKKETRLQELLKKLQDEEKDGKEQGGKKTKKEKVKQQQQDKDDKEKSTDNEENSSDKETKDGTHKDRSGDDDEQKLQNQLQDTRESIRNCKGFMYIIFDRFFAIFILTAMMQVIFCFYIQLSNLTYTNHVYSNSLNAGFFFLTYGTIVTGLYAIVYDYKTDKFVNFNCNKGKYAMFYIGLYLGFIIILGALYQTEVVLYVIAAFPIVAIVLIPYQVPYGLRRFNLQTIIAIICQLPFLASVAVSFILKFQQGNMSEQNSLILAYVIIGTVGLSIILTIGRMIKYIDCKKISFIELTDRKKDGKHDKNKRKNKILMIDESDLVKNNWQQCSQDSVRSVIHGRNQIQQKQEFNIQKQNEQAYEAISKRNQPKPLQKDKKEGVNEEQEDDEEIDELEKIKIKLRKDLKQKKMVGKVK